MPFVLAAGTALASPLGPLYLLIIIVIVIKLCTIRRR